MLSLVLVKLHQLSQADCEFSLQFPPLPINATRSQTAQTITPLAAASLRASRRYSARQAHPSYGLGVALLELGLLTVTA